MQKVNHGELKGGTKYTKRVGELGKIGPRHIIHHGACGRYEKHNATLISNSRAHNARANSGRFLPSV